MSEKAPRPLPAIDDNMSVRAILAAYPQTAPVLARYGMTGCGGAQGPDEPLRWFALVHKVDPEKLKRELEEAIAQAAASAQPLVSHAEDEGIYRRFVYAALFLTLTGGTAWGAINLTRISIEQKFPQLLAASNQAHGHIQIFGWVGLFIMGVAYHIVPRLKMTQLSGIRAARASFWLMLAGIVLRGVTQPFMNQSRLIAAMTISSGILECLAAVLFVLVIARTLSSSRQPREGFEKYLLAGTAWLGISLAVNLALLIEMAVTATRVLPVRFNAALLHAELGGFITMFILGVSLRTVPVFMGKRAPDGRRDAVAFWLLNGGLAGLALAEVWVQSSPVLAAYRVLFGFALAHSLGAFLFVWNLHLFEPPAMDLNHSPHPRDYEKFVYLAYGWFAISAGMVTVLYGWQAVTGQAVPHALAGGYRHAQTVGFITTLMLGYALRLLPVFSGHKLYSTRLLHATFWLIAVGNVLRVVFQSLTVFAVWPFAVAGISSYLELTAIALFAWNVVATLGGKATVKRPRRSIEEAVAGNWTVAEALERDPAALEIFIRHGFGMLANPIVRATMARMVTLEEATRIHRIPLEPLLQDLNAARATKPGPSSLVMLSGGAKS